MRNGPNGPGSSRPAFAWAAGMLAAYVLVVLPSLGQSLLETNAFRQTQTAYTALLFSENGIDLLRPSLPVLGPPGTVPLEFPLFQAIGSILISTGVSSDVAMRLTGLGAFLLSAVLLFVLARRLLNDAGALVALGAFLFNPHALLYGRSSLIEYLATAAGLAFLLFTIRWMDGGHRLLNWTLALLGAVVLVLVKVTTGPIFLLPALIWRSASGEWGFRKPLLWLLLVFSVTIGMAWSLHADGVRASSPATEFLAAENSFDWFFGSLAQRMDVGWWRLPLVALLGLTGSGLLIWPFLSMRLANIHPQRTFLIGLMVAIVAPVVILFNLYVWHGYYFAAVAPFVALAIGMGAQYLFGMPRSRTRGRLIVGLTGAWIATFIGMSGSWTLIYGTPREEAQAFESAAFIRDHSSPDDWVVIEGLGWNSTFLYYAHRRGFADPGDYNPWQTSDVDVGEIVSDPVYGPFFTCQPDGACTVSETRQAGNSGSSP